MSESPLNKKKRYVAHRGVRREGSVYPVASVTFPWVGGVGVLVGMPVVKLQLGKVAGAIETDVSGVIGMIEAKINSVPGPRPRWLALSGKTLQHFDNDLHAAIWARCKLQIYAETDGARSMCDSEDKGGRLPLYAHVCVRPKLPITDLKVELFHSVVVAPPYRVDQIEALDVILDRRTSQPSALHRFIVAGTSRDLRVIRRFADKWRLTGPVQIGGPAC